MPSATAAAMVDHSRCYCNEAVANLQRPGTRTPNSAVTTPQHARTYTTPTHRIGSALHKGVTLIVFYQLLLFVIQPNPTMSSASSSSSEEVLVLYGSQTGNSEAAAERQTECRSFLKASEGPAR